MQGEGDVFCSKCGKPAGAASGPPPQRPERRLVRVIPEKKIAGVCAGVAHYFNVDVTMVRVLWLVVAIGTGGAGLLAYLVGWIAMPAVTHS